MTQTKEGMAPGMAELPQGAVSPGSLPLDDFSLPSL